MNRGCPTSYMDMGKFCCFSVVVSILSLCQQIAHMFVVNMIGIAGVPMSFVCLFVFQQKMYNIGRFLEQPV